MYGLDEKDRLAGAVLNVVPVDLQAPPMQPPPMQPPPMPPVQRPESNSVILDALRAGLSGEIIEKMMVLEERRVRFEARREFDRAMSDAKAELPVIVKNNAVSFGTTHYRYEDLATISRQIDHILAKFGLAYRFKTSANPDLVTVQCIITHRDGHNDTTELSAAPDKSGGKNAIQSIGSVVTYLQRYTLKAALGLAASVDDDGISAGPRSSTISSQQVATISDMLEQVGGDRTKFLANFKVSSLDAIPADQYSRAVAMIRAKKGASK